MPHTRATASAGDRAGPRLWAWQAGGERADGRYGEGFATQVFINMGVTHLIGN
jgi:hypothetical protein